MEPLHFSSKLFILQAIYYLFNSDLKTERRCVISLSFWIKNPLVTILIAIIIINTCSLVLNRFPLPGLSSALLPHPPLGFSALTTYLSCSKFPRTVSNLRNLLLPHPFQIWVYCFLGTLLCCHPGPCSVILPGGPDFIGPVSSSFFLTSSICGQYLSNNFLKRVCGR